MSEMEEVLHINCLDYISPEFEIIDDDDSEKDETSAAANQADYKETKLITIQQENIKLEIEQEEFYCTPLKSEDNIPPQDSTQLKNQENCSSDNVPPRQKHKTAVFKCDQCNFSTIYIRNLKDHLKNRHGDAKKENLLKCPKCDFTTCYQKSIVNHVKYIHEKHNVAIYKCDQCSFGTVYFKNLRIHIRNKHEKPKEDSIHKCDQCDFGTMYPNNLRCHKKRRHRESNGVKFMCGHCFKQFTFKSGMKKHIIKKHVNMPSED